jgi:citrate synthase
MGRVSFAEGVFLALTGEMPTPAQARLINAIFVSSIDHGATPPSVQAARTASSTRATLSSSVAAGVLAITHVHGGAVEGAMRVLREAHEKVKEGTPVEEAAGWILDELKTRGERAPGFGHRIHTDDPRAKRLLELAGEAGVEGHFVSLARAMEKELEGRLGKRLPLNVDGAIGVVLCELGVDPALGNAFFIISRVPGLIAHSVEERTRERPMRVIDPRNHEYDGPRERSLDN